MERHIAKRLGIPCAVISAPVHVQDFPARSSPQMGFEGANVLFDTFVHPLMMGLEEHLLAMFRDDFEFADGAAPSHLGSHLATPMPAAEPEAAVQASVTEAAPAPATAATTTASSSTVSSTVSWASEAEQELKKIPFFVRGKARRNTELFARETGVAVVTLETLYDARAHFGR
jgi:light-independent protochlorophyllide reductase subunit B